MSAPVPRGQAWEQTPGPPSPRSHAGLVASVVMATAPVVCPSLVAASWGFVAAALTALACSLGVVSTHAVEPHRLVARWSIAVAVVAAVSMTTGLPVGLAAGAALLVSDWATRGVGPIRGLPDSGSDAGVALAVLSLVAAWTAVTDAPAWRIALPIALALVAPLLTRLGGGIVGRIAASIGERFGAVVSLVAFTLLGIITAVIPGVIQRVLRIDPMRNQRGWVRRRRRAVRASQPWTTDSQLAPIDVGPRVRTAAVSLLALLLVTLAVPATRDGLVRVVTDDVGRRPFELESSSPSGTADLTIEDEVPPDVEEYRPDPSERPAAMAESDWAYDGDYSSAQGWALQPQTAWRPINPYRLLDFRSPLLNVVDGRRLTWTPPECSCRRLRIWVYGGSTTYGLNQRDEHTIASYLAKIAARHGVTADVENRGANGHLHWMEAERFAWDLSHGQPPDMVLFYDGVNDHWATSALDFNGTGDIKPMIDPTTQDQWRDAGLSTGPVPEGPPGSRLVGLGDGETLHTEDLARLTVERYDRSRILSRTSAEAHGVIVRYLWQPSRLSRPLVSSEPHGDAAEENLGRLREQLTAAQLPDDVIDLTDSLRVTDEALFTDDVHHNERGAELIAEAIHSALSTDLQALWTEKNPS